MCYGLFPGSATGSIARALRAGVVIGRSDMKAVINLVRFFSCHPLTRDAPMKAWARFALWQISSLLRQEVIVPWIAGQRLAVRRGMTGATGNIYAGLHEFSDMMFLLHFLRPGDTFLDIGANVGSYTVLASGVCGAATWAFEPAPKTVNDLRRNIEINGLENLVTVFEFALGPSKAEIPFTIDLDTTNKVATEGVKNVRMVHQEMLDTLTANCTPVMVKMDVEGYEEEVLRGAQATLAIKSLKAIELETVTPEIKRMLFKNGFEQAYYDPFNRMLSQRPVDLPSANSLFLRDSVFVRSRLAAAKTVQVLGRTI
jgi:FkbM family methyltransferase